MSVRRVITRQLDPNAPFIGAIVLKTADIETNFGKEDKEEAFKALTYAADCWITFWDCADIHNHTEKLLGDWFRATGRRSKIFLATKFGAADLEKPEEWTMNSTPSYIRRAVERSLIRLDVATIDLYYQHRVDPKVPIEVVMQTLGELVGAGTIRYIGLCEASANTLRRAKAVTGVGEKLIVVQNEYGLFSLDMERADFTGTVNTTGVAVVASSPLGRGMAGGRYRFRADLQQGDLRLSLPRFSDEHFSKALAIMDELQRIATDKGANSAQIALAWILASHSNFFPLPGFRSLESLKEYVTATGISLTQGQIDALRSLAEKSAEVAEPRYPPKYLPTGESLPLSEWNGE